MLPRLVFVASGGDSVPVGGHIRPGHTLDLLFGGALPLALAGLGALPIKPMFNQDDQDTLAGLVVRATNADPTWVDPHFERYRVVEVDDAAVAQLIAGQLLEAGLASMAWIAEVPRTLPGDPDAGVQHHLDPAPGGVDAAAAAAVLGGDGAGVRLGDVEWGWYMDTPPVHLAAPDLVAHKAELLACGGNFSFVLTFPAYEHSTRVLSLAVGSVNGLEGQGVAPKPKSLVLAPGLKFTADSTDAVAATADYEKAILAALDKLEEGDVLLLELTATGKVVVDGLTIELDNVLVEAFPSVRELIRLATALGVTVIEPVGNVGTDLDTFVAPSWSGGAKADVFMLEDSGAVVVGGGTWEEADIAKKLTKGWVRWNDSAGSQSAYGLRVDCFAQASQVYSSFVKEGLAWYSDFGAAKGTSFSAAIVAGVALCMQGVAKANLGAPLSPGALRALLRDPSLNTASKNPATDRINSMPDLAKLIPSVTSRGDGVVRDFVGDDGSPHQHQPWRSPDIWMYDTPLYLPKLQLGTTLSSHLSQGSWGEIDSGGSTFIYVRARNVGAHKLAGAEVTVWSAVLTTLFHPAQWKLLGKRALGTLPLSGHLTTHTNPIVAGGLAPGQHLLLVAILDAPGDPGPGLPLQVDYKQLTKFVQANNNVACRHVILTSSGSDEAYFVKPWYPHSFLVMPPPGPIVPTTVLIEASLPPGSKLRLQAPAASAQALRILDPGGPIGAVVLKHAPTDTGLPDGARELIGSTWMSIVNREQVILSRASLGGRREVPLTLWVQLPMDDHLGGTVDVRLRRNDEPDLVLTLPIPPRKQRG